MITRNFLNFLAMCLQAGFAKGCLPVRVTTGENRFFMGDYSYTGTFPAQCAYAFTLNKDSSGISIGTGTAPATEDDYQLEAPITSGVSGSVTGRSFGAESPQSPYVKYDLTITNTGSAPITVTEIGYKQQIRTSKNIESTTGESGVILLDRSVLATPVTIAPGDAGVITYKLRTITEAEREPAAGIEMVNFSYGSDEQIAAILDAAAEGTIDLQRDAGWRVGDQRAIDLAAFTGGLNESSPAQKATIVITSFDEYMGCGNVLQFDFAAMPAANSGFYMHNGSGGVSYGATLMKTTTIPAMIEALPAWLKSRLKTFSVLVGSGGTVTEVTGNKLALRSEFELFGSSIKSPYEEGTPIPYYAEAKPNRTKSSGINGISRSEWWTRSIATTTSFSTVTADGSVNSGTITSRYGMAPFGCI